ncbi:hypothetical protein D3C76_1787950 [compost metagenome]
MRIQVSPLYVIHGHLIVFQEVPAVVLQQLWLREKRTSRLDQIQVAPSDSLLRIAVLLD